jgi:hypothetical protein
VQRSDAGVDQDRGQGGHGHPPDESGEQQQDGGHPEAAEVGTAGHQRGEHREPGPAEDDEDDKAPTPAASEAGSLAPRPVISFQALVRAIEPSAGTPTRSASWPSTTLQATPLRNPSMTE